MTRYVMDAMGKNPVMVGADRPAWSAVADAERRGVHHVLIVGDDPEDVIGIVSLETLRSADTTTAVGDLIEDPAVWVTDQAPIEEATHLMDEREVDCLPVRRWEGKLCGVVTRGDIARAREASGNYQTETCEACGAAVNLTTNLGPDVVFCERCAEQSERPEPPNDEIYFTVGGGS